jgi:hypothetical protein
MAQFEALVEELARGDDKTTFGRLLELLLSEDKDVNPAPAPGPYPVSVFDVPRPIGRDELCVGIVDVLAERLKRGDEPAFHALLDLLESSPIEGHDDYGHADEKRKEEIRRRLILLAVKKLGAIGDPRAVEPLLGRLLVYNQFTQVYGEAMQVLEQMIKPGDERAFRVLWGPGAADPNVDEPDEIVSNSRVKALGRFGDARAVGSLVARARTWSGEECSKVFEEGIPCYSCASSAAVSALEQILERDAARCSEKALRRALELDGLTSQTNPHSEHDSYRDRRDPIYCGTIHRLAREELERRGLQT